VDGIVFVADSQVERMESNMDSFENKKINQKEQGNDLERIPYVIQYNKRDLPNAAPVEEMRKLLNTKGVPDFEAVARNGDGVFDTLKNICRLVIVELRKGK